LTAAHCSDDRATQFNIIFGAVNMRNNEPNQQRRTVPVSGWIQHPSYNRLTLHNDIAVIRFPTQAVTLNQFVQVIALASETSNLWVGEPVHVSGFGRFSDDSPNSSDVLRFTVKNVITNLACRVRFPTLVIDSTICAIGDDQINNAV
jgi:secreted trypsin-like serine protease